MGLRERRRIKDLSDEVIPSLKSDLAGMCGVEIPWEVDWDSFTDMESLDNIEHQGLRRINDAFRNICYDEIGKQAVKDSVRKIVVKNFEKPENLSISFTDGVLTVHGAWAASWEGYPQEDEIRRILEDNI